MFTSMNPESEIPLFHVVGFSGHRQIAEPAGLERAIAAALESLRQQAKGEWLGLSSVAEGGDQLFVEQVRALGLAWHAILPLPKAEFAKDFTPVEWAAVERTLEHAEHVRVITENGTREDAYLDCGMATVDGADVLLAVWDGEPARGKGGTADVVSYARTLGKPLVLIDANTFKVTRENLGRLERTDTSLAKLNELPGVPTGTSGNPFKAPEAIFAFQQKCDHAASRGAPQFRRLIVLTVLLHVTATLIAAAALSFELHLAVLPWLKLLCLAGALGVALLLRHHHHSHHNWVRCRLAAEFCRSLLATWGLPRASPLFEDLDLPEIRGLSRSLHILHSRSANTQPVPIDDFKSIYIETRIDDQLAYFRRQEARALPMFNRFKLGFWIATVLALISTLAYAVCHSAHIEVPHWTRETVFYFLPISLPIIAAALISLISINDLQRRVARYREMQLMLEESRKRVVYCQTWNSLERVVLKTERALLQEVMEWHSLTSFAESH
jgi:conflict system pore-forming effector with SLATT domain